MQKTHGAPQLRRIDFDTLRNAARKSRQDMLAAPVFGLFFSGFYVVTGWLLVLITRITGDSYWLIFAAVGFPLFSPFAAVGLYEVSRRRELGLSLVWREILSVISEQRTRQLPSLCAVVIIIFLFWFFLAHMIFALFLGLSTMTNVSSSFEIYTTVNGLKMLTVGTIVGAIFALVLYMLTVMSLPMLLDREIDFVTAMLTSFQFVNDNRLVMICWGLLIAVGSFAALLPFFLGLFIAFPFFGHASWHLYRLSVCAEHSEAEPVAQPFREA